MYNSNIRIMKRLSLLMLATVLMSLTAGAVPVKPGLWKTLTLADGTTVRAEARGSEHGSWWEDSDGQCYVMQNGQYVQIERKTLAKNIEEARAMRHATTVQRRILGTATDDGRGKAGQNSWGSMPSNGDWDIPVLMVEFTDAKFKAEHTPELINDYLIMEGFKYSKSTKSCGSVRDYFVAQSHGKFKPNFKLLGKVAINKPYSYYGADDPNNPANIDVNCDELPGDAMRAAKEQLQNIDFTQFSKPAPDVWHKAGIPLICLLYAGEAQSGTDITNQIWPHQSDLNPGEGIDIDGIGVHLNSYFVGNELVVLNNDSTTEAQLEGIGVFCHELGHALGLPDWYCTNNKYKEDDAFGKWSIMDVGCYEGNSWAPVGYTAYERSFMGWQDIPTLQEKTSMQLTNPQGDKPAILIANPDDNKEYFILETRQPSTWYPNYQGTGLLLSRFAYDENEWMADSPNNVKDKKRGLAITADKGILNYSASNSNLFGNGVNSITEQKFWSGTALQATITNIQKNTDGSISFDFDPGTTAIEAIHTNSEADDNRWYDLQGRLLEGTPTAKGIYIHNGKKVIKK